MYNTLTYLFIFPDSPSISISASNISEIMERGEIILNCNVTSNPASDIKLSNMTDNTTSYLWNNVNSAECHFINASCLDTGGSKFTAYNGIPDEDFIIQIAAYIDIKHK